MYIQLDARQPIGTKLNFCVERKLCKLSRLKSGEMCAYCLNRLTDCCRGCF